MILPQQLLEAASVARLVRLGTVYQGQLLTWTMIFVHASRRKVFSRETRGKQKERNTVRKARARDSSSPRDSREMLKVAICGGSGYTGCELLRILSNHPNIEITAVTSEKSAGKRITEVFPHLHRYKYLFYEPLNQKALLNKAYIFFLALPHGTSQDTVNFLFNNNKRVIDLSADYRLSAPDVYREWYGIPHKFISTLKKAVYGFPEIFKNKIRKTRLKAK